MDNTRLVCAAALVLALTGPAAAAGPADAPPGRDLLFRLSSGVAPH